MTEVREHVPALLRCSCPHRSGWHACLARLGSQARLSPGGRGVVGRSLTQASQLPHGEGGDYASG